MLGYPNISLAPIILYIRPIIILCLMIAWLKAFWSLQPIREPGLCLFGKSGWILLVGFNMLERLHWVRHELRSCRRRSLLQVSLPLLLHQLSSFLSFSVMLSRAWSWLKFITHMVATRLFSMNISFRQYQKVSVVTLRYYLFVIIVKVMVTSERQRK